MQYSVSVLWADLAVNDCAVKTHGNKYATAYVCVPRVDKGKFYTSDTFPSAKL